MKRSDVITALMFFSVFAAALGVCGEKVSNPFSGLEFDKVVAFEYESTEGRLIVDRLGWVKELFGSIERKKQLNLDQIKEIGSCLGDISTYGGQKAFCFIPRLGLVYYLKGDVVAHVSICMECNYLESSLEIPALKEQEKVFFSEGGKDFYYLEGFSKKGRQRINELCKALGFIHCLEKLDTMFDE